MITKKASVKSFSALFFYSLLLTLPTCYYYITVGDYKRLVIGYLMSVMLYCIPVYFFRNNLHRYFKILYAFILLAPLFIYPIYAFQSEIVHRTLLMIIESSVHDKIGFLKSINPVVSVPVILFYLAGYFTISHLPTTLARNKALVLSVITVIFPFLLAALPYKAYNYGKRLEIYLTRFYPLKYVVLFVDGDLKEYFNMDKKRKNAKILYRTLAPTEQTKEKEIYVFLLGETARRDKFSLFGYERQTTPRLDTTSNLIPLRNFYADGHCTMFSAPMILTGTRADSFDIFYKRTAILQEMKMQGFSDIWIGSKYSRGTNSIDIFSREAEERIFPGESCCFDTDANYDEALLTPLREKLKSTDKEKIFIVMHFIGSHWNYSDHYPENFSRFQPTSKGERMEFFDENSYPKIKNDYDNTIFYSDYIMSEIIETVNMENAVSFVFYLSDHGENLFDDERKLYTHWLATKHTQEIPAFVWYSDKYSDKYPHKILELNRNASEAALGSSGFFTFLDLAGSEFVGKTDAAKSLAHPNFKSPQIRFFTESGIKDTGYLK